MMTAKQIVSTMLEEFTGNFDDRAGGPSDMWRQGGHKKFNFKAHKFSGKRPGEADKPESEDEETEEKEEKSAPAKPAPKPAQKHSARFQWKPQAD